MSDLLFKKLCNEKLLKRAWHLARVDANAGFVEDPYHYNDYAFQIDKKLGALRDTIRDGTYHPRRLLRIDIPKDTYSVRPGTLIDINDLIVLYAITLLIAERLDKKLPDTVYSYRYKPSMKRRTLFRDDEILEYTFLKKKTIKIKIDIFEPWYDKWPSFMEKSVYTFEKEGYKYLSISDIAAYFENIQLDILREFLLRYFPKNQKIINLFINILEHWTWPTECLRGIRRGIPQGNSISSFLGNVYLLPLDEAFKKFSEKYKIRYFRYMDDVKIFSKSPQAAIKAIFEMNAVLRKLHLNMQTSKTLIKYDNQIRKELIDDRMNKINPLIDELQRGKLTKERRNEILEIFLGQKETLSPDERFEGKDLRFFRRLITGFALLHEPHLVQLVIGQVRINPDARLTKSAANYLRLFPRESKIARQILKHLGSATNLFPYQEALLLRMLRYFSVHELAIQKYAQKAYRKKGKHWYIRCQAVNVLAKKVIRRSSFDSYVTKFEQETDPEVKRTFVKVLCQLDSRGQRGILYKALYDPTPKMSDLAKMLLSLRRDDGQAGNEIRYIFEDCYERKLVDHFYKVEVMRFHKSHNVVMKLSESLFKVLPIIQSRYLRLKINTILEQTRYKQQKLGVGRK